jgi:hypothetical protein
MEELKSLFMALSMKIKVTPIKIKIKNMKIQKFSIFIR